MSNWGPNWRVVAAVLAAALAGSGESRAQPLSDPVELSADEVHVRRNLAFALITEGEYASAWPHLEALIAAGEDSWWIHLSAAQICLYWRLDLECTEREAARVLELRPDNPRVHLLLGQLAEERGDDPTAIGHYYDALALRSSDAEVSFRLANLLDAAGQPEAAAEVLSAARVHHPRDARLILRLARLLEGRDDATAEALYQSLPRYHDDLASAYGHLLRFYESRGRVDDAETVREQMDALVERRTFRPIR